MAKPQRTLDLVGWQSWTDCRFLTQNTSHRNFSPHHHNFSVITHPPKTHKSKPPTGWSSWHYFGPNISESLILAQAQAAAKLSLDYILIDDGWTTWGDWLTPNTKKFPHGLTWLVKSIASLGLKTGIWWAPLLAKSSSRLFHASPNWFVKNADGTFLDGTKAQPWDLFIRDKRRVLDLEKPQVQKYLLSVLNYFRSSGISLVKSDFLYAYHFHPKFSSPHIPNRLLHNFLRTCHRRFYTIASGCPLEPAVGAVSAMRISDDINLPHLRHIWPLNTLVIDHRLRQLEANLAARKNTASLWHLDPDAYISDPALGITPSQSRKLARLIKSAAGVRFLGDNLLNSSLTPGI